MSSHAFFAPRSIAEVEDILKKRPPRALRSDDATALRLQKGSLVRTLPPSRPLRDAAVFVPLLQKSDGLHVVLTRRAEHLHHHGGQVSFPGGRRDEGDKGAVGTALRETEEEIGIPPSQTRILGRLDDYITITGYHVRPVVGEIIPPWHYVTDHMEVAEVFDAPLDFVLNPENIHKDYHEMPGFGRRYYYAISYNDHYIWGATAAMLVNFSEVLTGQCAF